MDGLVLDETNKKKIDILITSSNNVDKRAIKEFNVLDKTIRDAVERCHSFGGMVFIVCFQSEQLLEIIIILESFLREKPEYSSISYELYHTFKYQKLKNYYST